jgi:hypothetical protein
MIPRPAVPLAVVAGVLVLAIVAWRSQLFVVSRPGDGPRPLTLLEVRAPARLDVVLPVAPVGMRRLEGGAGVLLIHYWAPWERHGRAQAATLDSLLHLDTSRGVDGVIGCFDPFPSVARAVARQRLRVPVLIDTRRDLQAALPCPSVPYTYVLDRAGRIAVAQAGEVDWLSDATRAVLDQLLSETAPAPADSVIATAT